MVNIHSVISNTVLEKRDLSFNPVVNDAPRCLSVEQINSYNEDGYIKPLRIFSDEENIKNRNYFDHLIRLLKEQNDGRNTYAINGYQAHCKGIWDIAMDSRILDYVEDLIGPNIIAWATHYFCKIHHDKTFVPWHQDASYWPISPARTVTVWIAIDDADEGNAAMQFIPGTHKLGHLKWKKSSKLAVLEQEIPETTQYGKPIYVNLKAGEISLHADMMVHGSTQNTSSRRRCGLTVRYCPPEVKSMSDSWKANSIICRGEDRDNHWANNPRPKGDDLSSNVSNFKPSS